MEGLSKAADTYNDMLFQTQGNYIQGISDKYLTEKAYEKQLRLKGSDVMARIEIPKISVDLPIYQMCIRDSEVILRPSVLTHK